MKIVQVKDIKVIRELEKKVLGSASSIEKYYSLKYPIMFAAVIDGKYVGFLVCHVKLLKGQECWHNWICGVIDEFKHAGVFKLLHREYLLHCPKKCKLLTVATFEHWPAMYKNCKKHMEEWYREGKKIVFKTRSPHA